MFYQRLMHQFLFKVKYHIQYKNFSQNLIRSKVKKIEIFVIRVVVVEDLSKFIILLRNLFLLS